MEKANNQTKALWKTGRDCCDEVYIAYREVKRTGFSGADLKRIAMVCMFIDHIGCALIEPSILQRSSEALTYLNWLLRGIGRLAFPLYGFLLVEGCRHTRSFGKYLMRLAITGAASEIPYDLAFAGRSVDWYSQNVVITLFIGLVALILLGRIRHFFSEYRALKLMFMAAVCISAAALAEFTRCDYGAAGVLIIVIMDLLWNQKNLRNLSIEMLLLSLSPLEVTACLSFPLLNCYNGTRGSQSQHRMYLFYPGHLMLLSIIRIIIIR